MSARRAKRRSAGAAGDRRAPGPPPPPASPVVTLQFESATERLSSYVILAAAAAAALPFLAADLLSGRDRYAILAPFAALAVVLLRALLEEYREVDLARREVRFVRRLFFTARRKVEARLADVKHLELRSAPAPSRDDPGRRVLSPWLVLANGNALRAGRDEEDGHAARGALRDLAARLGVPHRNSLVGAPGPEDAAALPGPRPAGDSGAGVPAGGRDLSAALDSPWAFAASGFLVLAILVLFGVGVYTLNRRLPPSIAPCTASPFLLAAAGFALASFRLREKLAFDDQGRRVLRLRADGARPEPLEAWPYDAFVAVGLTTSWSFRDKGTRFWHLRLLSGDGSTLAAAARSTDHEAMERYGRRVAARLRVPFVDGRQESGPLSFWNHSGFTDRPLVVDRTARPVAYRRCEGALESLLHAVVLPALRRPGVDLALMGLYAFVVYIFIAIALEKLL